MTLLILFSVPCLILLALAAFSQAGGPLPGVTISACTIEGDTCSGLMDQETLLGNFESFRQYYEQYQPDPLAVARLKDLEGDCRLVTVLGTWCPDSQRNVSKLLKALAEAANPRIALTLVGMSRQEIRGGSPVTQAYGVTHVPTIIAYRDGRELGRMVEHPDMSVEEDVADFLER